MIVSNNFFIKSVMSLRGKAAGLNLGI